MNNNKHQVAGAPKAALMTAGLLWLAACGPDAPPAPPPMQVTVYEVEPRTVPLYIEQVGQTRCSVDIPNRARVD